MMISDVAADDFGFIKKVMKKGDTFYIIESIRNGVSDEPRYLHKTGNITYE